MTNVKFKTKGRYRHASTWRGNLQGSSSSLVLWTGLGLSDGVRAALGLGFVRCGGLGDWEMGGMGWGSE